MRQMIAYLMCAFVAVAVALAFAPRHAPTVADTELLTDRVQVNGLLNVGTRQIAVGERGIILISDDRGRSWRQAQVEPQRPLSLTALAEVDAEHLVAVGQDGWILHSRDAGASWQEAHYEAEQGEPLLGAWAAEDNQVFAFGSYGRFYQSDDAGQTWRSLSLDIDHAHLNGMDGGADGRRMLVGEQGLVLRTADGGQHWQTLPPFYQGSLFGVARLSAERWVTYGMRGHVFVSADFGEHWQAVDVGNTLPLYGHVLLPDHAGMLIVGAGSSLVRLGAQGQLLATRRQAGLGTLTSAIVVGGTDHVLVGGERGVFQGTGDNLAVLGKSEVQHETR